MGNVINIDAKIVGTADPRRLKAIVGVLSRDAQNNTVAMNAKLAAAKRLLGVK